MFVLHVCVTKFNKMKTKRKNPYDIFNWCVICIYTICIDVEFVLMKLIRKVWQSKGSEMRHDAKWIEMRSTRWCMYVFSGLLLWEELQQLLLIKSESSEEHKWLLVPLISQLDRSSSPFSYYFVDYFRCFERSTLWDRLRVFKNSSISS